MSFEEITQALAIKVEAETAEAKRAVDNLFSSFGGLAKVVEDATKKSKAFGNALGGGLLDKAPMAIGKLTQEVKTLNREVTAVEAKSGGLFGRWNDDLARLGMKVAGVGFAFKIAGNYLSGAFDRAKLDPALEGINRLRIATESWTTEWERRIDRVLSKIASAAMDSTEADQSQRYTATAVGQHRGQALMNARRAFRQIYGYDFNPDDPHRYDIGAMQREAVTMNALILQAQRGQDASVAGRAGAVTTAGMVGVTGSMFAGGGARGAGGIGIPTSGGNERPVPIGLLYNPGFSRPPSTNLPLMEDMGYSAGTALTFGRKEAFGDIFGGSQGGAFRGILDDALAKMNEVSEASQTVQNVLGAGLAAGLQALATGQENAGKAALRAIANECLGLSVMFGARSIGAFAGGNIPGGIGYAAAAAAAAGGARLLNGLAGGGGQAAQSPGYAGGPGAAPGGGAPAGWYSSSNDNGRGGDTIILQVGDGFVGKPAELAAEIEETLRAGKRSGRIRSSSGAVTMR